MRVSKSSILRLDWLSVFLYLSLVSIGWFNIYSASLNENFSSYFELSQAYGKQLLFIGLSIPLIIFLLSIEIKFYERFASLIYLLSLASLLGLFVFGKNINGATSWYVIGSLSIQPSEFAKVATALALAKYLSDIQTNIKTLKHQLGAFLIVILPALLIVLQPDPGSATVYAAFFFVLHREGLSSLYFILAVIFAILFVLTLLITPFYTSLGLVLVTMLFYFYKKTGNRKKTKLLPFLGMLTIAITFCYSVNFVFNSVFEQRHRDRFNIVLGKSVDTKSIGYNTNQSQIAIGSGGLSGKGWLEGTQTKGGFVPEQHTDYIFSTIGEEFGFLGTAGVVLIFVLLILRIIVLAEREKSQFARVLGYGTAAMLFFHFAINIGMVIGMLPTIGIPLPFISYGGSSLLGFTVLLFIFLKFHADRLN